ncbi:MAG: hypothetical protein RL531_26 [Actinomycetota bacterium]|jgi:hypothetical protein
MAMQSPRGAALLVSGLALLALAFVGWTIETTVLSPTALHDATDDLLAQPTARDATESAVARGLTLALPGLDPVATADLSAAIVDRPEFVSAFADAIVTVRDRVVRGTPPDHAGSPLDIDAGPDAPRDDPRFTIDGARIDAALHAVAATDPRFGGLATASVGLVGIPADAVPDLHREFRAIQLLLRAAGIIGLVLVTLGIAQTRRRSEALGRIGRWAFFTGALTFLAYRVLPHLLEVGGGWWGAGGALVRAGDGLTTVALILVLLGGLAMLIAREWARHERRSVLAAVPVTPAGRHRSRGWHPAA